MPRASCDVCLSRIYATDIQICRCDAAAANGDCRHWMPHQDEISGLCESARIGCRMCSELWRHFFKEWTPEQYAGEPTLIAVPGTENQPPSSRFTGPGFPIGPTMHTFINSGIWYRVVELTSDSARRRATSSVQGDSQDDDIVLALDFGISSPMIYEVEERRYVLRKTSDYERLITLFMSGLLQTDEGSSADPHDVSQKRWDWVRKWMLECERDHTICSRALRANQSSRWFPTRLIHVKARLDGDGCKHYLLSETASIAPEGHRYATLSHIWGSGPEHQRPAYRTLRNNYSTRITNGIPREELPACFQDAIDVTERLGIPYLWIDSLCIIQEDARDWATEAGCMSDVYRNSFLNLSATASSSSKDHFPSLVPTRHSQEQSPQAPRLQEPRFVMTRWTGRFAGAYQIFDPHLWADRVSSTRLASRGWIFQERALAPRVLHFGFDQVLWECAESERAEEFPLGIPQRFIDSGRRGFKWQLSVDLAQIAAANDDNAAVDGAGSNHEQHRVLDEKWAKAIDNYTRCELTKAMDKLVAISGVAQVLADNFHDNYVAGLWRSNLVGGLCWRVPQMRRATQDLIPSGLYARRWEISRRYVQYLAPSWSWASVDGEVTAGPFVSERRVTFRTQLGQEAYKTMRSLVGAPDVDTIPVTDIPVTDTNEFGEVKRTEMRLRGTLYQLGATAGESPSDKRFSFCYADSSEPAVVYLDQPEELQAIKVAYFLPLVYVECCLTETATNATPEPRAGSWATRLKQKGKSLVRKDATASSPDGIVTIDANNVVPNHDLDQVLGIVVVRNSNKISDVYRRVGFHECKASVLEELQKKPNTSLLEDLYTLI